MGPASTKSQVQKRLFRQKDTHTPTKIGLGNHCDHMTRLLEHFFSPRTKIVRREKHEFFNSRDEKIIIRILKVSNFGCSLIDYCDLGEQGEMVENSLYLT